MATTFTSNSGNNCSSSSSSLPIFPFSKSFFLGRTKKVDEASLEINREHRLPFMSWNETMMQDGNKTSPQVPGDVSSETDVPKREGCRRRGLFFGKIEKKPQALTKSLLHLFPSPTGSAKLLTPFPQLPLPTLPHPFPFSTQSWPLICLGHLLEPRYHLKPLPLLLCIRSPPCYCRASGSASRARKPCTDPS